MLDIMILHLEDDLLLFQNQPFLLRLICCQFVESVPYKTAVTLNRVWIRTW